MRARQAFAPAPRGSRSSVRRHGRHLGLRVGQHEYRFRRKDGGYRWLRAEVRLLRDASGNPVEAVGSWSDVTARKEAELRLQESEEQYRLLFDSNPFPMAVIDQETYVRTNPEAHPGPYAMLAVSDTGHGTTFKVFLPRVEAEEEKKARVDVAAPPGGTETILLVEDA